MKTSSGAKMVGLVSNSKVKKTDKDREKRKSQLGTDNPEKGSPVKDGNLRKFAGIGPDSLIVYHEQSGPDDHLSEELCCGLAEDISYKLRYIIHDAMVKARLSGRNHIVSSDVDATLENLSVDKVYGATTLPIWIPFGEQNLFYLDDPVVNLIDLAEQESSYVQPAGIIVTRKWSPDIKDIGKPLIKYFETLCFAAVSNDCEVRRAALVDLKTNDRIGPIVEWFYHFGYFLLSKDITYDSLTLCALDLIRALEENAIAPQIVSEKQLKLLVRLILQRLLRSATTVEVLCPMSRVLAMLCDRLPIRELVTLKMMQKMPEVKKNFDLSIVTVINELGGEAFDDLLEPNLDYFLVRMEQKMEANLVAAMLNSYKVVANQNNPSINNRFHRFFGDALVPMWKSPPDIQKVNRPETNWRNIKSQLLKTRRRVTYLTSSRRWSSIEETFPKYERYTTRPPIVFRFHSFDPVEGRQRFLNMSPGDVTEARSDGHIVGPFMVPYHVGKTYLHRSGLHETCRDHTLASLII